MARDLGALTFVCEMRDVVARHALAGSWEPTQTLLVRTLLEPGMTFVDVGAQWGYFTLIAAGRVGARGRVLSLEPHPMLFGLLRDNLARNGLSWVTALPIAAGAGAARQVLVGFEEDRENLGGSWLRPGPAVVAGRDDGRVECVVDVCTLDDLISRQSLEAVDLLKMDIEGGEGQAIHGMKGFLTTGRVRRLIIEVHADLIPHCGGTLASLYADLRSSGYCGFGVRADSATVRGVAYGHLRDVNRVVHPLDPRAPLSGIHHQLWLAPGISIAHR